MSGNGLWVTTTNYWHFWLEHAGKIGGRLEESLFVEDLFQERLKRRRLESPLISGTGETDENEIGKERRVKEDAILTKERDVFKQWFKFLSGV